MSETSKAAPRPWKAELDGIYSRIIDAEGKPVATNDYESGVGLDEDQAVLIVEAVNSYNPDRDKLARELGEEVETFWKNVDQTKIGEPNINIPAPSRSKARQLLSLFKEASPADTNSHEIRRARGAM